MRNLMIFMLLLAFCSFFACSADRSADLHHHVQGFWKVTQVQQTGETNELYAEINDSVIQYWYERINYIFPYLYRIEDDQLVVWLQGDSLSRPTVMGTLTPTGAEGFTLENPEQRLEYRKASFDDFERAQGRSWRGIR